MKLIPRRRFVAACCAVALIACVVLYHGFFKGEDKPHYLSAEVTRADLEDAVLATGILQARKQVDVGAQASGQLQSLKVALGDKVAKGQWLARIDPTLSQNALRQAQVGEEALQAQRRAAVARMQQAELVHRRQQQMLQTDATSREDAESAQAAWDVARAELASLDAELRKARIEVEKAQANVGYTRIVAPIDGEVVALVTQEGQTVIAEQQAPVILKLADLDTMTIKAQVSEADIIRVKPGLPLYFTILGEPDQRYTGTLRALEPVPPDFADAQSAGSGDASKSMKPGTAVFYNALFDVPNPEHRLRIAMTAQVNIVLGEAHEALNIPASALGVKSANGTYEVRVLRDDGTVETREVQIGINNHVMAQVLAGLKEGERVVVGEVPASDDASSTSDAGH